MTTTTYPTNLKWLIQLTIVISTLVFCMPTLVDSKKQPARQGISPVGLTAYVKNPLPPKLNLASYYLVKNLPNETATVTATIPAQYAGFIPV
ncbi:hypothetical protein HDU76_005941, partial [Blyttiomyces sp. JEL0837]